MPRNYPSASKRPPKHDHFHWHINGMAHEHEHDVGHHGPAFGKTHVTVVEPTSEAIASVLLDEPDLPFLLRKSIEAEEAKRRDK